MKRLLVAGVLALALPLTALAAAVVESVKGEVQAEGVALTKGQKVLAQTTITTGPGAQVFLRFEDGMQIVVGENSWLRVLDFTYKPGSAANRAAFQHLKGSARVVTGNIVASNPKGFFFHTTQTQLTAERPADFTVAIVNPVYVSVNAGTVLSSNTAGTVALNAGSTSVVATTAAAPAAIPISSMPASASSSMSTLSMASVSAPTGGAAAGVAAGAAGGAGFGIAAPVIFVGAAVAGVAAAAAANGDTPSTTTHH